MANLISVVMATHNGEKYLKQQLESVLSQGYRDFEIIVVDDASSDSSHEIAVEIAAKDRRVKAYRNETNLGVTANFLKAVFLAKGSFICFCDQDDVWRMDKVELLAGLLRSDPRNMLAYSDLEVCDESLNIIRRSFMKSSGIHPKSGVFGDKAMLRNIAPGCSMMFRRDVADRLAKASVETPFMHDHLAFVLSSLLGRVAYTKEKLVKYRQHPQNNIGAFFQSRFEKEKYMDGLGRKIEWFEKTFPDLEGLCANVRRFHNSFGQGSLAARLSLARYYLFLREDSFLAQALGCLQCFSPRFYDRIRGTRKPSTAVYCTLCDGLCVYQYKGVDRLHHLAGEFELFCCKNCGLILISPALPEETLSQYYPEDYYSYSDSKKIEANATPPNKTLYYLKHPLKAANAVLYSKLLGQNRDENVSAGSYVLDVGCGDGGYLMKKREMGAVCFGVDISRAAIERLKKQDPQITTFCGNLWDAGFPEQRFDLVNLCHVLEHVKQTDKLLGEIGRLLKPGGRLRLQVPNAASITFALFRKYWMGLDTPRHVYVFSRNNLEKLFQREGFTVVSVRTMENSFSVIGSSLYLWNDLFGQKNELMKLERLWNSEILKIILFPYCFLVNALGLGDSIELIIKKEEA